MHSAKTMPWLWVVLALVACEASNDRPDGAERAGAGGVGGAGGAGIAPGAGVGPGPGVGGSEPDGVASGMGASGTGASPGYDPGPAPSGGDTSDLGTAGRGCAGQVTGSEVVSLEQARARGFDPEALLALAEGVYEGDVRWDRPFAEPATRARVQITRDGAATIHSWDCRPSLSTVIRNCYAGNVLAVHVRVAIETADGRVQGSFVSAVRSDNALGSWTRLDSGSEVYVWATHNGPSPFDGTVSLGPGAPTSSAVIWFSALTPAGGEPSMSIQVTTFDAASGGDRRDFNAWPLDGCQVWRDFRAEPADDDCPAARFEPGSCCGELKMRFAPQLREPSYPISFGTDLSCDARNDDDGGAAGG